MPKHDVHFVSNASIGIIKVIPGYSTGNLEYQTQPLMLLVTHHEAFVAFVAGIASQGEPPSLDAGLPTVSLIPPYFQTAFQGTAAPTKKVENILLMHVSK